MSLITDSEYRTTVNGFLFLEDVNAAFSECVDIDISMAISYGNAQPLWRTPQAATGYWHPWRRGRRLMGGTLWRILGEEERVQNDGCEGVGYHPNPQYGGGTARDSRLMHHNGGGQG